MEVQFNATPFKTADFRWDLNLNWTQKKSLVVELLNGIENLQLASLQGGISINKLQGNLMERSEVVIIFADNGKPIINQTGSRIGTYQRTGESNNVIGDINADWKAGLNNSITYKNLNLSFLLDMQKEMFSLLTHGMVTLQECMIFCR
jgi:hypothetical protein